MHSNMYAWIGAGLRICILWVGITICMHHNNYLCIGMPHTIEYVCSGLLQNKVESHFLESFPMFPNYKATGNQSFSHIVQKIIPLNKPCFSMKLM